MTALHTLAQNPGWNGPITSGLLPILAVGFTVLAARHILTPSGNLGRGVTYLVCAVAVVAIVPIYVQAVAQ